MTRPKLPIVQSQGFTVSVISAMLLAPIWAVASNLLWLDTAPVRFFSERDSEIFVDAFRRAMNEQPDGAEVEWQNDETGSGGVIRLLSTERDADRLCRKVRIDNQAGGHQGSGTADFCKQPDGSWKVETRRARQTSAPAATAPDSIQATE